ncbi:MAG: 16S rRNA methyltransferase [Promethearchaeota archaeon]
MIKLILVESGLELIPRELWEHPSVVSLARRRNKSPGKLLLDTNYHHSAMVNLPERQKRGRPDIVHFCLLNALNIPLNHEMNCLDVIVHVKYPREIMIFFDRAIKLPRSLNRFEGLIAQYLSNKRKKRIDTGDLIHVKDIRLEDYLRGINKVHIHAFSRVGQLDSFSRVLDETAFKPCESGEDLVILIGGFQSGTFSSSILDLIPPRNIHSISRLPLDSWTVVSRVLFLMEMNARKNKED